MPRQQQTTTLSTLLVGLLVGVGIMQLIGMNDRPPDPVPVEATVSFPETSTTMARSTTSSRPLLSNAVAEPAIDRGQDSISYASRAELEQVLPESIVNVLIEHNTLLIERVDPDAP